MKHYEWIGLRKRNNFSYTKGEKPIYSSDCHNSLIISDLNNGLVEGVNNQAIIKFNGSVYQIPINEIDSIINFSSNILKGGKIFYEKPLSIVEKEKLENLSSKDIKRNIFESYNIKICNLSEIENKKGKNRIYELFSYGGDKFILKYQGENSVLFETKSNFLNLINYFPKVLPTIKNNFHILLKDKVYGLEEFVEGDRFPLDKNNYFQLIGKHMALMHNEIILTSNSNKTLEKMLFQGDDFLSESNIISMFIDLGNNFDNEILLNKINSFYKDLNQKLLLLPTQIIHGDLNKSNLIWNGNDVKIIDSENIMFSKRIREFIPALLLEGNLSYPRYNPNSLRKILNSYNTHLKNGLSKVEEEILPEALIISLVKLYAIYNTRRNLESKEFKDHILNNLNILGDEFHVY